MPTYLVAYIPPLQDESNRYYYVSKGKPECSRDLRLVLKESALTICIDPEPTLLRLAESGGSLPGSLVDLAQLKRQACGRPQKEFAPGRAPWSNVELLRAQYENQENRLRRCLNVLVGASIEPAEERDSLLLEMVVALEATGRKIIEDLVEKGEWQRFVNVEVPIQRCCHKTQLAGIRFERGQVAQHVRAVSEELYSHRNVLQLEYDIFDVSQGSRVAAALRGIGKGTLANVVEFGGPYQDLIRVLAAKDDTHPLVVALDGERRASADRTALVRLGGADTEVFFPVFETMGTVTGRIQMRFPAIQSLRRRYRGVIRAASGKKLLYLDYDQFEARILGDLSGDPALLDDLGSGDFYRRLAATANKPDCGPPSEAERKCWKRLFFAYCYGPVDRDWSALGDELLGRDASEGVVERAFGRYQGVRRFREDLERSVVRDGFVETLEGNRRYVRPGRQQAPRWTLNQRIQGTASLILKEAICAAVKITGVDFLIPMHDAALFQVPSASGDALKAAIKQAFESAMLRRCPNVLPSASFEPFTGSEV